MNGRRTVLTVLTLATLAALITTVIASSNQKPRAIDSASPAPVPSPARVVGVDELMKKDPIPRTMMLVEGVVSAASSAEGSLALIDRSEFDQCRVTTCASLTLPVRWAGPMPSVAQAVRVDGEVQKVKGKLIFAARRLEVLKTTTRKRP